MEQVYLLVSAGGGPMECRLAVGHVLAQIRHEAEVLGVDVSCSTDDKAPASALIALQGAGSRLMAATWIGTVQWRQASQLRPGHRRANWFVGVFALPAPETGPGGIPLAEVQFSSFRAGGPGGQHQNTTDSAVRAVWRGFSAVSRDGRSQHQQRRAPDQRPMPTPTTANWKGAIPDGSFSGRISLRRSGHDGLDGNETLRQKKSHPHEVPA